MYLRREITSNSKTNVSVGELILMFGVGADSRSPRDAYPESDSKVEDAMLIVYDPAGPWLKRHRSLLLEKGKWQALPNGTRVKLSRATQSRITIDVENPARAEGLQP